MQINRASSFSPSGRRIGIESKLPSINAAVVAAAAVPRFCMVKKGGACRPDQEQVTLGSERHLKQLNSCMFLTRLLNQRERLRLPALDVAHVSYICGFELEVMPHRVA